MLLTLLVTILCLTLSYLLYCYLQHLKEVKRVQHIPGRNYPFELLFFFFYAKYDFYFLNFRQCHNLKEFGPYWRITAGTKTFVYLTKPEHVKEVFITHNKHFIKNEGLTKKVQLVNKTNNIFAAKGGEEWARHRALCNNGFTDGKLKEYFENHFHEIIGKRAMNQLRKESQENDGIVNMSQLMSNITIDIIGKVGFGLNCNSIEDKNEQLPYLSNQCFRAAQILLFLPESLIHILSNILPIQRLKEASNVMKEWPALLRNIVMEKKKELANELDESVNVKKDNLITQMLKQESEKYAKFTIDEVISNSNVVLLAGNDTTSITLSWLWYFLAQRLDLQKKIKKEIDNFIVKNRSTNNQALNTKDINLTLEEFDNNFPFIKNCIYETLRLRIPAPNIPRIAAKTVKFNNDGLIIPKDCHTIVMLGMIHLNEKYFGENVEEFHPERFEKLDLEKERFIFNPFAAGIRKCIGYKFAMLEMVDVIVNVMQRYQLELAMENNVKEVINFTVGPDKPIFVKVTPWNN
ncbi:hypothetical protein ABK040_011572 [Willaertia magna]